MGWIEVQRGRKQGGHDAGTVAAVAVPYVVELGFADPMPAFNAPALPNEIDLPCGLGISTQRTIDIRIRQQNDLWNGLKVA